MTAKGSAKQVWWTKYTTRAIEAARVGVWAWQVDTDKFGMDERGFELWGLLQGDRVTFEQLSVRIHPVDQDRVPSGN